MALTVMQDTRSGILVIDVAFSMSRLKVYLSCYLLPISNLWSFEFRKLFHQGLFSHTQVLHR